MALTFQLNTSKLAAQLAALRADGMHAATSTCQLWGKRTVKKLGWKTAKAAEHYRNSGRLRAGWLPAAITLNAGGVYSGTYRNHGEGGCLDLSRDPQNPTIVMWNSVAFWPHVKGLMESLQQGIDELTARAQRELEGDFARFSKEMKPA